MALVKIIHKDLNRRMTFQKKELNNKIFNYILLNDHCDKDLKKKILLKKHRMNKRSTKALFTNRCVETGRERGILRYFRLSRIEAKKSMEKGTLYGIQKASW